MGFCKLNDVFFDIFYIFTKISRVVLIPIVLMCILLSGVSKEVCMCVGALNKVRVDKDNGDKN